MLSKTGKFRNDPAGGTLISLDDRNKECRGKSDMLRDTYDPSIQEAEPAGPHKFKVSQSTM